MCLFALHGTDTTQHISYAKTKSDTIAKLDGTFKLPDVEGADEKPTEQTGAAASMFGSAPVKAVPVNEEVKGVKRGRDEEEEEEDSEDDDAEMQMSESDEE